jgi:hypothetical protein
LCSSLTQSLALLTSRSLHLCYRIYNVSFLEVKRINKCMCITKHNLREWWCLRKTSNSYKMQSQVRHCCFSFISDFLPFMKSLSCNPIYMLFILISVLQFNAFANMFSFMPKFLEQQYGKSTSDAIFLIGMLVSLCFSSTLLPSWNLLGKLGDS